MTRSKTCPITGEPMRHLFNHRVLGKYDVDYFFSEKSGIIQTEEPYWLTEAYGSVISELDTWVAVRNVGNAKRMEPLLALLFPADAVIVDVACGYGILTRLLRDMGFNCFGHDKYCENIFAKAFQPPPNIRATVVCAFEVLEHLMNPIQFLAEQMKLYEADTMVLSTSTFCGAAPGLDWPYYSFESGQHLTIYQPRTLELVASALGCRYFRLASDLHLVTRRQMPVWKLGVLKTRYVRTIHNLLTRARRRRKSLTLADYEMLRQRIPSAVESQSSRLGRA